jgi:biofilm PGA synthesis N-glycosyltransferase PgaC
LALQDSALIEGESVDPKKPGGLLGKKTQRLSKNSRFVLVFALALFWALFALFIALPWIEDLGGIISLPLAILTIFGLAIIPGYLAFFLLASILLDKPEKLPPPNGSPNDWPGVSVLVAAYNEEKEIADTLLYLLASEYRGALEIIVIDDGSSDRTQKIASSILGVKVINDGHRGKPEALNRGLAEARHDLILSLDADTLITPQALERLVSRMIKEGAIAVAGAVMALNVHDNWLTRMQQWDYQMGIASIKRSQAVWQNTSVAQGAFSLYRKKALTESGGWQEMVGEDIVLTWSFLERGYCVDFEPTALAFTKIPSSLLGFARQRSRWARGMFEGLRSHGKGIVKKRRLATHGVLINSLFPLVDASYTLAFIPGIFLALAFSNFAIVGPITLLVIPLNILVFSLMYREQRRMFREIGVKTHKNRLGFIAYLFLYQALIAPISLLGYIEEVFQRRKIWRASK